MDSDTVNGTWTSAENKLGEGLRGVTTLILTLICTGRLRLTGRAAARPVLGGVLVLAAQTLSAQTIDEFSKNFKEGVRRECLITQRNAAENAIHRYAAA